MESLEKKTVVWIHFQEILLTENLHYRYFTARQICKLQVTIQMFPLKQIFLDFKQDIIVGQSREKNFLKPSLDFNV